MAWAKVQSTLQRVASGANAKAFASSNTAGNCLIARVLLESDSATVSSLVNSSGTAWTAIGSLLGGGNGYRAQLYYAKNCAGGANTVTLTPSTGASELTIYEFSGLDTAAPFEAAPSPNVNSGTGTTADSGNLTTLGADRLLFGFGVSNQQLSTGSGFTTQENNNFNFSSWDETKNAATAGVYSAFEPVASSNAWIMGAAAFKEAGGAPPVVARRGLMMMGVG